MASLNGITVKGPKSIDGQEGIVWVPPSCLRQFGRVRNSKDLRFM